MPASGRAGRTAGWFSCAAPHKPIACSRLPLRMSWRSSTSTRASRGFTLSCNSRNRTTLRERDRGADPARSADDGQRHDRHLRAREHSQERVGGGAMRPFVVNGHGRLVFPSNFSAEVDFSVLETFEQLEAVIRRDFEAKAPSGTEILQRVESNVYSSRHELLHDVAMNLVWGNRYAMTMYEKRPTRWRDLPRHRDDVFLPLLTPWEQGERKVAAVAAAWTELPPTWDADAEDRIFTLLFDIFRHKRHHAAELSPVKPTVAEITANPKNLTFCVPPHDPAYPTHSYQEILDCAETVPELEPIHRLAMVLHNQHPWDLARTRLVEVGKIGDDDFVVAFVPRNHEVFEFIRRVKAGRPPRPRPPAPAEAQEPGEPFMPVVVREQFALMPRLESLTVVKGEHVCTNEDVIRNTAYSWSPMTAAEIQEKTGIEQRLYTQRRLAHISLQAARAALEGAGRRAEEIGAVIFCSCTSTRLIPSVATWLSGQLGIFQTHGSFDIVAACAGFSLRGARHLVPGLSPRAAAVEEPVRPDAAGRPRGRACRRRVRAHGVHGEIPRLPVRCCPGRLDRRALRDLHQRIQPVRLGPPGAPGDLRGDTGRRPRQPPRGHRRRVRRLHRLHRADQVPAVAGVAARVRPGDASDPHRPPDHPDAQVQA